MLHGFSTTKSVVAKTVQDAKFDTELSYEHFIKKMSLRQLDDMMRQVGPYINKLYSILSLEYDKNVDQLMYELNILYENIYWRLLGASRLKEMFPSSFAFRGSGAGDAGICFNGIRFG